MSGGPARFVIGVDLGTTNCAVAYVDRRGAGQVKLFEVPQLVAPGEVARRELLPSCIYFPPPHELAAGGLSVPFGARRDDVVGELARRLGGRVSGRLVTSSKSWLSHERVERRAPILPWQGAEDAPRLSPVQAASRLLEHIRDAWDAVMGEGDPARAFTRQEVIITVPASFDAVARSLTVEAAQAAGIERPILIEEPQAALYAWIGAHAGRLAELLPPGSRVLVVDVGGGTTDLTVVTVERGEPQAGEELRLERVAVSEHLLLGGDNVDVAIARLAVPRLEARGPRLEARDWPLLQLAAREVKEALLAEGAPQSARLVLPGSGARLVGGVRSAEIGRAEVEELVLEGFLPRVPLEDAVPRRSRAGLLELGLPYAADPAITRHLGAFLRRHAPPGERLLAPSAVLFNGGMLKHAAIRARIREVIGQWAGQVPVELETTGFDLAVALGAAYYGLVRQGRGIRIRGGLPRCYYVGVDAGGGASGGAVPGAAGAGGGARGGGAARGQAQDQHPGGLSAVRLDGARRPAGHAAGRVRSGGRRGGAARAAAAGGAAAHQEAAGRAPARGAGRGRLAAQRARGAGARAACHRWQRAQLAAGADGAARPGARR
ncbi:MAG: hypothetical protein KatS3mg102_2043 [Planctomycetota bacterium]|nr:MAG: hypothetical protein KatS3mg102_2043 [Planctomycetota bacterium]